MAEAKDGDTVKVHYTGKFEDGTVFDSTDGRDPLEFTLGNGQLIAGFEKALIGMNPGESKTSNIPQDEAYGPRNEEMKQVVERNQLPPDLDPQVGMQLQVKTPEDQTLIVSIAEVSDTHVTLDANHPLAGKDLNFDIQLVEIV
jgi:FKBP-type peptidyl-prolyl cis-trans isomerase 2